MRVHLAEPNEGTPETMGLRKNSPRAPVGTLPFWIYAFNSSMTNLLDIDIDIVTARHLKKKLAGKP